MTEVDAAEAFGSLVRSRHSIRGFRPDRVPQPLLEKVFEDASWAPSGTNVQPWQLLVASGDVCETLREGFLQRFDDRVEGVHAVDVARHVHVDDEAQARSWRRARELFDRGYGDSQAAMTELARAFHSLRSIEPPGISPWDPVALLGWVEAGGASRHERKLRYCSAR